MEDKNCFVRHKYLLHLTPEKEGVSPKLGAGAGVAMTVSGLQQPQRPHPESWPLAKVMRRTTSGQGPGSSPGLGDLEW